MMKKYMSLIIVMLALSLIAAQCEIAVPAGAPVEENAPAETASGPEIAVLEPYVRASIPNGAVYMQLTNSGSDDDMLVNVEIDAAESAELHKTTMDDKGVMKMGPIKAVEIPAGESATLEPGGMHIMLLGLKEGLASGDTINLTLNFANSEPQMLTVEVREGLVASHDDQLKEDSDEVDDQTDHTQMDESDDKAGDQAIRDDQMEEDGDTADDQADHAHKDDDAVDHDNGEMGMGEAGTFEAVIATYLLDTAGLHGLDERLNETGEIMASDAGTIARVERVVANTAWPEALQEQAVELRELLAAYAEALSNDNLEAAKPLATEAHDVGHDFSHAVEHWLEGHDTTEHSNGEMGMGEAGTFEAVIATYLLDTAGLHGLDERLNETGEIMASDAGTIARVERVVANTIWPEALQEQAVELRELLAAYAEALSNDDLEAAKPLATEAHDVGHDFSHAVEHWLGEKAEQGDGHGHGE